jgi:ribose transport system permease protein
MNRKRLVTVLGLVVVLIGIAIMSPYSLHPVSFLNTTKEASYLGVVAIGQTIVMLTGGIDMSLYEIVSLTNVFAANFMQPKGYSIILITILSLLLAAAIGMVNGTMIAKTGIPSIIMTIAMGFAVRGTYLVLTKGAPRGDIPDVIRFIGRGKIFNLVPVALFVWLGLAILTVLVLTRTPAGRAIYCTGSNPLAARLSGIRTDMVIITAYMTSSITAAVTGLLVSGYLGMGTLNAGEGYLLAPIAATVIGGTTFAGGIGGVGGTIIGALIIRYLDNLLTLLRAKYAGKLVVQGIIIGGIAMIYSRQKERV